MHRHVHERFVNVLEYRRRELEKREKMEKKEESDDDDDEEEEEEEEESDDYESELEDKSEREAVNH